MKSRLIYNVGNLKGDVIIRKKMPRGKDKRIFSKTAAKHRDINLNPISMRGGIRL